MISKPIPKSKWPEYGIWRVIKARCFNNAQKDYPRYGGQGIRVCEGWKNNFQLFLNQVGYRPSPRHILARLDPKGDYAPGNCKWMTRGEEGMRRRSKQRIDADVNGIHPVRFRRLLKLGWTPPTELFA